MELLSGNEAIAQGAWEAGARIGVAYPGTPSTETLEAFAKKDGVYAEWCVNEKVAVEVGIGASAGGARVLSTMKHVGVNVAADPLFTAAYTGVGGGFVVLAADDPGMYSSQNEQDSHYYACAAHIPMLDPADSAEALAFTRDAFELSERFDVPFFIRSSVRVSHTKTPVVVGFRKEVEPAPYESNPAKWVMMPAFAKPRRKVQLERIEALSEWAETCAYNQVVRRGDKVGVVCAGAVSQHVLEGLLIAEDNIDEVIKTIRESYDNAKERLMERFNLSEIQAQVVLDMQLKRLQGLEREKLEAEYEELEKRIAYYRELLSNEEMLKGVLKDELTAIRDKYGDDRLTEIQDVEDEIDIEDLIEEEQCVFTLSHAGYCKRVPASTYRSQKRGGRGVTGMTTKEEDFVEGVFTASTHDYILFFTNLGKVHRRKGYQIPEAGRTAKGTNLVNILPFEPGEKVTAGITVHEFDEDYLVFVTRNGTVKRLELASLNTARKAGIRALTLSEGDELIAVMKTDGKQDILLASANGMVICFNENDVRVMGRDAAGVRGMMLDAGDYVVGAGIASRGKQLLSVTECGYGKRTEIESYLRLGEDGQRRPQNRGGKGLKGYNITAKTGKIAGVAIVDDADDIMLIENGGVLIRMAAADINVYGRDTQGVILMRLESGSRVISVDRVDREPEEPAENEEA